MVPFSRGLCDANCEWVDLAIVLFSLTFATAPRKLAR